MITQDERPAKPLPAFKEHAQHAHAHHSDAHHGHGHHRHLHPVQAKHTHRHAPEPRFSLIALSAVQRLALIAPAVVVLGLLALWATQNG
jgi:hypothetical protein